MNAAGYTFIIPWVPILECPHCLVRMAGQHGEMAMLHMGRPVIAYCMTFSCECGFRAMAPTTPEGVPVANLTKGVS